MREIDVSTLNPRFTMHTPLDESQLLALIENKLDSATAARLKAALADHPEQLALIERMQADRTLLRSLPEPALPRDLMEALEPALARPMLLAPLSASDYRKQHAYARRPRVMRLAMAAAVLLAALAGVWAASTGILTRSNDMSPPGDNLLASRTPGEDLSPSRLDQDGRLTEPGNTLLASAATLPPEDRITVHHLPPPVDVRAELANAARALGKPDAPSAAADTALAAAQPPCEAPFVLVIETASADDAVAMLKASTAQVDLPVALVRNVTEEEVIRYGHMLAMRSAAERGNREAPATASVDESPNDRPALPAANSPARAFEPLLREASKDHNLDLGEQLAGDPRHAAAIADQLRYSTAGVQYALTVPADRVAETLMALNLAPGLTTSLRTFDTLQEEGEAFPRAQSPELLWIDHLRRIRTALAQAGLPQSGDVVIPVRVEVRGARKRN